VAEYGGVLLVENPYIAGEPFFREKGEVEGFASE